MTTTEGGTTVGIDLTNNDSMYEDLAGHIGHEIECVSYGDGANVAVECVTCNEVMLDADAPQPTFASEADEVAYYLARCAAEGLDVVRRSSGRWYVRKDAVDGHDAPGLYGSGSSLREAYEYYKGEGYER